MPKIEQKNLENTLNLAKIDVENLENGLKKLPDTPVYSYIDINDLQGLFHTIYKYYDQGTHWVFTKKYGKYGIFGN